MKFPLQFPILSVAVVLLISSIFTSARAEAVWHESYDDAIAEANKDGKNILIVFTGTDWIEMCKIFYRDILSQEDFLKPVGEKFALLKLEYAKDNRAPKKLAFQNQLLKDAYRIKGFPMVVVTDRQGRPFGVNGYQPIPAAEYAKSVLGMNDLLLERAAQLKVAGTLEGVEKAKMLGESIPELPGNLAARYFSDEMKEVVAADPENEAGFNERFARLLADVEYSKQMQVLSKDVKWLDMLKLTDRYIQDNGLEGAEKQSALMNKYGIQKKIGEAKGIVQSLLDVVEVDPESSIGKEAQKILDTWRAKTLEEALVP